MTAINTIYRVSVVTAFATLCCLLFGWLLSEPLISPLMEHGGIAPYIAGALPALFMLPAAGFLGHLLSLSRLSMFFVVLLTLILAVVGLFILKAPVLTFVVPSALCSLPASLGGMWAASSLFPNVSPAAKQS